MNERIVYIDNVECLMNDYGICINGIIKHLERDYTIDQIERVFNKIMIINAMFY